MLTDIELSSEMEFSLGLAKITAKTKDSPKVRSRLRDYLEARTDNLIASINDEVLTPAIDALKKQRGKHGLVILVDNLDRVDNRVKNSKRTQPEYLFIDRGEQLKRLRCHLVYTIPLTLTFSNDSATLNSRFGVSPKTLAMVPVCSRYGKPDRKGLDLLEQMVLTRAFPELSRNERLERIAELFAEPELLERLCRMSGGHVRNVMSFVYTCLQKTDPPFSADLLEEVFQEYRDLLVKTITPDEWELLRQVKKNRQVAGEQDYKTLLRSMFVFEYKGAKKGGAWYGINPLLANAEQLREN